MSTFKNGASRFKSDRQVVGVAWYSADEWLNLKRCAADPEILEATYAEWCGIYADAIQKLERAGVAWVRVPLVIAEVSEWCARNGRPLDAAARAGFVADTLRVTGAGAGGV
jgi:hypothetical protein